MGLFDTPEQVRQAQQQAQAQNFQQNGLQGGLFNLGQSLGNVAQRGIAGADTRTPEEMAAISMQQLTQGIDPSNRESMLAGVQRLAQAGHQKEALQLMQMVPKLDAAKDRPTYSDVNGRRRYSDNGELVNASVTKDEGVDKPKPSNATKMMRELIDGDPERGVPGMDPKLARRVAFNTLKQGQDPTTGDLFLFDETDPTKPIILSEGDTVALKFQKDLRAFGDAVEKSGVSEQEFVLQEAEKHLFKTDKQGNKVIVDDIAGFGQTGALHNALLTQKGKDTRQAIATIMNMTLKDRSGAAVAPHEFVRFKQEFSSGAFQTDRDLANAMIRLRGIFDRHKQSIAAGYVDNVVGKYSKNSGIKFRPADTGKKSGRMVKGPDGKWRPAE